jgi:hypothetical protein
VANPSAPPKDGVFHVESVKIEQKFLDLSYERRDENPATRPANGLLKLFELVAVDESLPVRRFVARWNDREQLIKFDAFNARRDLLQEFKFQQAAQRKGHGGHHTSRLNDRETLSFACEVRWSDRDIFVAVVELTGLRILKHVTAAIKGLGVGASATIVRRPH